MKIRNIRKINNENLYDINTENKVFLCKEIINDDFQNNNINNKINETKKDNILFNNNICIEYTDKEKMGIIYDKRKISTYSKKIG
jgi:hypothetical protein